MYAQYIVPVVNDNKGWIKQGEEKLETGRDLQRMPKKWTCVSPAHRVFSQLIMVPACLTSIFLLLLVPLPAQSEDRECEGVTDECVHYSECQPYTRAVEKKKTLRKPSCELRVTRKRLKDVLCNKDEQKVCCGLCDLDQECISQKDCPSFSNERKSLAKLEKGSSEYKSAEEKLKKKICDPASQSVCCEKPSQCNSDQPQSSSRVAAAKSGGERIKSCNPANALCVKPLRNLEIKNLPK